MGTRILFTKLDTGIFFISYLFLSYQNQQYCLCMQTLRNAFNVNGIHQWEQWKKLLKLCKKKMLVRHVLFDIRVNFCPSLQMMPALKNQCTVSIEYFYLPTLLKKTKMICSLAVNHRWKEKPSLQFVLKDIL